MKTKKIAAMVALAALLALCGGLIGCGTIKTQATFDLGGPADQRKPVKEVDIKTGAVKYVPDKPATMDIGLLQQRDFLEEVSVSGAAINNPAEQEQYWEKRTVTEWEKGDTRSCPLDEQITELRKNERGRSDEFRSVKTIPKKSIPLTPAMSSRRGLGAEALLTAEEAAGNVATAATVGVSFPKNKGDNNYLNNQQDQGQGQATDNKLNAKLVSKPVQIQKTNTNVDVKNTAISKSQATGKGEATINPGGGSHCK